MFGRNIIVWISILGALIGVCQGYWRMNCGVVQTGRIDPVVNPGKLAGHAHKIAGASSKHSLVKSFYHLL